MPDPRKPKSAYLPALTALVAAACSGTTAEPDTAIESTPAPVAEAPAAIDPSVSISNYGAKSAEAPLPVLEATEINKNRYGSYVPSFSFMNETGTDLDNLRVGVVCYDASDSIIGGGSMYPGLAPAGKSIRLDADSLTVTGIPASCKAFMNYS